jgi:hypothetical protein
VRELFNECNIFGARAMTFSKLLVRSTCYGSIRDSRLSAFSPQYNGNAHLIAWINSPDRLPSGQSRLLASC